MQINAPKFEKTDEHFEGLAMNPLVPPHGSTAGFVLGMGPSPMVAQKGEGARSACAVGVQSDDHPV